MLSDVMNGVWERRDSRCLSLSESGNWQLGVLWHHFRIQKVQEKEWYV
jgi:hypothetical protein